MHEPSHSQFRSHAQATHAQLEALLELNKLIRECASFEEHVLYPWAEQQLRTSKKGEFLQQARVLTLAPARQGRHR